MAAALAAPAAATQPPMDAAAMEAELEAALEAYERFGADITACMAEVGIAFDWDDEEAETDEAEAALQDRLDEPCDAGRLDEAEALHREMMPALHGLTPAQYDEAQECAAAAAARMHARYVEVFGEEDVPLLDAQNLHICDG